MQTVDEFYLECGIDFHGAGSIDDVMKKLNALRESLERLGYTEADITKALNQGIADYTRDAETRLKILDEYNKERARKQEEARRNEEAARQREEKRRRLEEYRQYRDRQMQVQRLSGIANPFAFLAPKSGVRVQQLLNNLGRVIPKVQGLSVVFQSAKGVWDFAAAIAELNTKILQLGNTSGLGAQKLADLGAAVAAFGGSAESVAKGSERFIMQIEKMKRGGGLGYIGEVAYKYGFSMDLNASWEENNKAAIAHARKMIASGDETGAMAFLKDLDASNYDSNLRKAKMSEERVARNDAFFKSYDELGDFDRATDETQKFNEETAKAQRAWQAITNQMATSLLPLITKLTSFVTKIADAIAKTPGLLKTIQIIIMAITGAVTALIAKELIVTGLHIAQAVAKGKWLAAVAAGAIAGIAVAGIGMSMAGDGDDNGRSKVAKQEHVADAVSVKDIASGKVVLSARERYLLNEQDKEAFGTGFDQEWEGLRNSSVSLEEVFIKVHGAAEKMKEALSDAASEAMSLEEAEKYASIMSAISNVSNVANSNTMNNANVNVNVSQTFNGADSAETREGIYQMGSDVANDIAQASRRFVT